MAKQLKKMSIILLLIVVAAGCSFGKKAKEDPGPVPNDYVVSALDDESISKVINDYFGKLYSLPPESYISDNTSGMIPAGIKSFIAKQTIEEGQGNPEIGLHYPRFVSINGYTAVQYEIIRDKGQPKIKADFIGMNGNGYLYFVKVDLKAKCLADKVFTSLYREDPSSRTYVKVSDPNSIPSDMMRLEAKYDVEIVKDAGEYKIRKATETANQYGYKNRLFRLNNDFISRLSYLDIEKDSSGAYVNGTDGEQFEMEKNLIRDFFQNLNQLDNERFKLLKIQWNKGQPEFQSFMDKVGVTKNKDGKEIVQIGSDYKQKFDISSFPLKPVMQKIIDFKNFDITPHPSYTGSNRKYIVKMEADVQQVNGISDRNCVYEFDYYVTLSGNKDYLKISSIKLNGYFI